MKPRPANKAFAIKMKDGSVRVMRCIPEFVFDDTWLEPDAQVEINRWGPEEAEKVDRFVEVAEAEIPEDRVARRAWAQAKFN